MQLWPISQRLSALFSLATCRFTGATHAGDQEFTGTHTRIGWESCREPMRPRSDALETGNEFLELLFFKLGVTPLAVRIE